MSYTALPLHVSRTLAGIAPNSRKSVVQTLARQAAQDLDLHPVGMNDTLQQRAHDPIGTGAGVAVIDQMVEHLAEPYLLVAQLAHPIDVNASDAQKIDLVCVLLCPADDRVAHIRMTGRLTRAMRDPVLCHKLRSANSADAMSALFMSPEVEILAA